MRRFMKCHAVFVLQLMSGATAALGRPLDRFVDGAGRRARLTEAAVDGCDFYRPLALFPLWERTFSRQELLDEALTPRPAAMPDAIEKAVARTPGRRQAAQGFDATFKTTQALR